MSLLSSIQMGANALQAQQLGLQVVGQNIANSNTPGYSVETLGVIPGPTEQDGRLLLGSGVEIEGVQAQVDQFLNAQVRSGLSTQTGTGISSQTYQQLESLFGALNNTNGGTNLDTAMTTFFSSIAQILNNPADPTNQQALAVNRRPDPRNHLQSIVVERHAAPLQPERPGAERRDEREQFIESDRDAQHSDRPTPGHQRNHEQSSSRSVRPA